MAKRLDFLIKSIDQAL